MEAILLVFSLTASVCLGAPGKTPQLSKSERPATWAVAVEKGGLPNLFQVSSNLFRGAQPTHAGMVQLKAMGIKTVLSLRGMHEDEELIAGTGLAHEQIRFYTWQPEEKDMLRFLKVATDPARLPVFVHCKRGIDRTGTMVAIYRMCVQGWPKEEAIREMTQGGFGYDGMFANLVAYLRNLDVKKLKEKAGLAQ
jgi:protein tyrosine/serine phosphatase